MPRSAATASQGATLASWSRRLTTSSSPAAQSRARARETASVSVVMFAPNAISSRRAFSRSAAAQCASAETASTAIDIVNDRPAFAVPPTRCAVIASIASEHIWVPPGASK